MEGGEEDNGVGQSAMGGVLMRAEGEVEQDPAQQARAHFAEDFDIKNLVKEGESDTRVELSSNKEVVEDVARVAARGKLPMCRVRATTVGDRERPEVDEEGDEGGDEKIGGDDLWDIVPNECP